MLIEALEILQATLKKYILSLLVASQAPFPHVISSIFCTMLPYREGSPRCYREIFGAIPLKGELQDAIGLNE